MTGLYVSITPDGKIKRHLSTEHGEVPLEDTTIFGELISLTDKTFLDICIYIKGVLFSTFGSGSYEAGAIYLRRMTDTNL